MAAPLQRKHSQSENAFVTQYSLARDELAAAIDKEKRGQAASSEEKKVKKEIEITEHLMSVADVLKKHETHDTKGLTDAQVLAKREIFGRNCLTPPPKKPMWLVFLTHLSGFFSLLLWGASILCFIAFALQPLDETNLYLGIVLALVVVMTGIFSFYQDYQSAAVMEGFKSFLPAKSTVIRNSEALDIPSEDLVPGDIVMVKAGDKIPADFRVVSSSQFKVNNSSLTGENLPQKRDVDNTHENPLEATNLAFYGTMCESGNAVGIIIATADETVIGKIANLATSTENLETPIAQEIHHFIKIISAVAIFLGVTFLIIGFVLGVDPISNLVFAIGIIVANVPEGLLATVTVALTLTAKRMAKKFVLVKNLEAVETLGSTTVIASDKTGTLTQNIMTVVHVYYDGHIKLCPDASVQGGADAFDSSNPSFNRLRLIATLCNNAKFDKAEGNLDKEIQQRATIGDASESALIKFCERVEGIEQVRGQNNKLAEIPFSSANKYAVTIHMVNNNPESPRLLAMKGAPERIFCRCDYTLVNGKKVKITDEMSKTLDKAMEVLMGGGERVLGFCYNELDPNEFGPDFEYNIEEPNFPLEKGSGMVFAGLMSLMDPPRPAVPGAVLSCQRAGIKVIMVTGDHPDTAEAIARKVNIITGKTRKDLARARKVDIEKVHKYDNEIKAVVITGAQLLELSDEELDFYLDFPEIVFARTSPQQKLRIVQGLQRKTKICRGYPEDDPKGVEHVVAVTGDGVNDSPALKAANIGVAMGIVGSDVAKDAADMILLNDNFASIVDGVEEGRLIFDNLKKSIAYTLSSNIPEISPFLVFILIQIPLPLPTVLILCIDLGTDMIPAISLAYELKEANIMKKPPRDMRHDRLVTGKLINFSYLQIGMVQAAAGFYTYVVVMSQYGFPPEILMGRAMWFYKDAYMKTYIGTENPEPNKTGFGNFLQYCGQQGDVCGAGHLPANAPCHTVKAAASDVSTWSAEDPSKCHYVQMGVCQWTVAENKVCYDGFEALRHAQCAFFIAIIVVQWADLLICKTRTLSLFEQGMRNGTLNFGLAFTTVLGSFLCYTPKLDRVLGTAPLMFVHWCPAMPFCIFITMYDEVRKWIMRKEIDARQNKGAPMGWVEKNTYY